MLKVAIIGTGFISGAHIASYLKFPDRCKIVALVDIFPEKCYSKKVEYNLNVNVYNSHKELLENEALDLVSICTPPFTHAEIAIDSMQKGVAVVVEKPMATSLEECDRMLAVSQETGSFMSIIAQNRFTDPMMKLKTLLSESLIGKICHAQVDSYWWRGHCYYDLWWRGTYEKEGGGCTLNHAVHHIDLLLWMMGTPTDVTAISTNVSHDNAEIEDLSIAILRYPNQALAQLTSSVVHHGQDQKLIFQGEDAMIASPFKVHASKSSGNGFPEKNPELERIIEDRYQAITPLTHTDHSGQIDNILHAFIEGHPPLISGTDGRNTIELITAIYYASNFNTRVTLPIDSSHPFYSFHGIVSQMKHFYEKNPNQTLQGEHL